MGIEYTRNRTYQGSKIMLLLAMPYPDEPRKYIPERVKADKQ